jgi:multidrug efflux pump subunit AcrB
MVFFLIVIFSGVYGLILQQVLPRKLFDEVPSETVASQVDLSTAKPLEEENAVVYRAESETLTSFHEKHLKKYLTTGKKSGSELASATESARLFVRLRQSVPKELEPATYKLEKLAELRRQWDHQVKLNWWLHNWLIVHLPLSVLMVGFMIIHAVLAMKWW